MTRCEAITVGAQPCSSWAGEYALNPLDERPLFLNDLMVVENCYCSGSGSGGKMESHAVGRTAAASYVDDECLDLFGDEIFRASGISVAKCKVEPKNP